MRCALYLTLVFSLISASASGQTTIAPVPVSACIVQALKSARVDDKVYQCGRCDKNAARFVQTLQERIPGFELDQAKVFIIDAKKNAIVGFRALKGVKSWNYHVIVEYKGVVLDLDHNASGQVYSFEHYLRKMFFPDDRELVELLDFFKITDAISNQDRAENFQIYEIPAETYLMAFQELSKKYENKPQLVNARSILDLISGDKNLKIKRKIELNEYLNPSRPFPEPTYKFSPTEEALTSEGRWKVLRDLGTNKLHGLSWQHDGIYYKIDFYARNVSVSNNSIYINSDAGVKFFLTQARHFVKSRPYLEKEISGLGR